jgi:hypothetical protein
MLTSSSSAVDRGFEPWSWNDDEVHFVLDPGRRNKLSWIFIVLAHWNSPQIDMFPNSDTLSWFTANQSMVSMLTSSSSAVDRGFEPWSGQTKDYKIGICCFSAKPTIMLHVHVISTLCCWQILEIFTLVWASHHLCLRLTIFLLQKITKITLEGLITYTIWFLSVFGYICICWKQPCWCIDVYNSYKIYHFDYSCDKFMKL